MKNTYIYHMKIFVDDERLPKDLVGYEGEWVVANSFAHFKEIVLQCYHHHIDIDCISFDHDLGENSKDGYECAKWLTEQYVVIPEVWSHSMNTPGKINILTIMKNWQKFNNLPENVKWIQLKLKK